MPFANRLFLLALLSFALSVVVSAQESQSQARKQSPVVTEKTTAPASEIDEIKRLLREQQQEIGRLRDMLAKQAEVIEKIQNREAQAALNTTSEPAATDPKTSQTTASTQTDSIEKRLEKVEAATKKTTQDIAANQLGNIKFSGDIRLQYDSVYHQLNNAANVNNPAILGNELNSRHRGRLRLRLELGGKLGEDVFSGAFAANGVKRKEKEFDWGIRLSTGSLADVISSNQVLTDFFNRKQFALDQAYVGWRPRIVPGLRIVAGKFDPTWTRTEMTIDNDVQVEGLSEIYSRDIKNPILKNVTLSAWQLPALERNATFVRNANGTVNLDESSRAGRNLTMYGAQLQTRFAVTPKTNLTLSAANLNFAGTSGINPIQTFGNQLQLPVTITIPASGATPAQTVSGVATISRDLLVAGNGNLGLTSATNAAVNRDGRLASGFNLVDLIARMDFNQYRHAPVTFLLDYVRNTQVRDVVAADAAGNNRFLPNNEDSGVWAEFQVKSLRKKRKEEFNDPVQGDISFGYTFIQIEKDAVLTPFNLSELAQQSDVRAQRLAFTYWANRRVTFNITSLFTHRLHGLPGPFANAPAGSLNRDTIRLQFDTIYKF